jgi:hypothetical protein
MHISRRIMEHYSHARINLEREAVAKLKDGLMNVPRPTDLKTPRTA